MPSFAHKPDARTLVETYLPRQLEKPLTHEQRRILKLTPLLRLCEEGHMKPEELARLLRDQEVVYGARDDRREEEPEDQESRRQPAAPTPDKWTDLLAAAEFERAWAQSFVWARWVGGRHDVEQYRRGTIGSTFLNEQGAYDFVTAPSRRLFTRWQLERAGVPIIGHQASLVSLHSHSEKKPMMPTPSLEELQATDAVWDSSLVPGHGLCDLHEAVVHFDPPGRELTSRCYTSYPGRPRGDFVWHYPNYIGDSTTFHGSVVDELACLSETVSEYYPWTRNQAAQFILTDGMPFITPVPFEFGVGSGVQPDHILLKPEHWISADTVRTVYLFARREWAALSDRRKRDKRGLGAPAYRVFTFVQERDDQYRGHWTWVGLFEQWKAKVAAAEGEEAQKYAGLQHGIWKNDNPQDPPRKTSGDFRGVYMEASRALGKMSGLMGPINRRPPRKPKEDRTSEA
jgi:hypothetical protein